MREAYRVVRCTLRVTTCSRCPWSPDWRAEWAVTLSPQTAKCQGFLHQNIVLTAPQHVGCELLCCFFSSVFSLSSSLKMVSHRLWKPTAIPIFDFNSAQFSFVLSGYLFWALPVSCLSCKQLWHSRLTMDLYEHTHKSCLQFVLKSPLNHLSCFVFTTKCKPNDWFMLDMK